ncbi:MAG: hypothetical protein AB8G99_09820, partial [Planctomycetaceae bacterium]
MKIASYSICAVVILAACGSTASAQSDENNTDSVSVDQILELCYLVGDRHVDPPATQQLVLSAAKAIYETANKPAPRELSSQVSLLKT